jgi:succinoglycan biosynthesis protein ExoA
MKKVSLIIPCYNEEKTIETVLNAVYDQDFLKTEMEVIIADGNSNDRTLEIINKYRSSHPDLSICVTPNPQKNIPAALNLAIRASEGNIIVRMDAHSLPARDYVSRCVQNLEEGKGDNVGGRWEIIPGRDTWIARGISAAAAHPLGVGNVRYRLSGEAGPVDTVPFGSYFRALFNRIGLFDETLLTNEDYELNTRIRQQGGTIWFDPEIHCKYYSRPNISELARQYWRYGYWKAKMIKRYPSSIKSRQLLPPVFVALLITLFILGLFMNQFLYGLLAVFLLYLGIIILVSIPEAGKHKDLSLAVSMPIAILTMHLTWGTGFIVSIII